MAAIWLVLVAAAELGVERVVALRVLVGPLRVLVVLAYGATILQATQSLQVPAFSAGILAAWAVGSLAYAYAVTSYGALVLGISIGVGWYLFAGTESSDETAAVVLGLALPVPLLLAAGMAHARTALAPFGRPWRGLAVIIGLATFVAAALAVAILGVRRRSPRITDAASGATTRGPSSSRCARRKAGRGCCAAAGLSPKRRRTGRTCGAPPTDRSPAASSRSSPPRATPGASGRGCRGRAASRG